MTDNNTTPWNGIPDDPHQSGWHWIGYPERMEAVQWLAKGQVWLNTKGYWGTPFNVDEVEYLGPAKPPASRCCNGTRRVAVNAKFLRDHDMMCVTMSDGSTHYFDGYYWKDGEPVFEIIGKTIPELIAAAKRYRDPAPEGDEK